MNDYPLQRANDLSEQSLQELKAIRGLLVELLWLTAPQASRLDKDYFCRAWAPPYERREGK